MASAKSQDQGVRQDRRRADPGSTSHPSLLWLLFVGLWVVYGGTLLLGAVPFRAEPGLVFTRSLYLVYTLACSWPLWAFCEYLWRRNWFWPKAMLAATLVSYPLACVGTVLTDWIVYTAAAKPSAPTMFMWSAFAATSPFCILILWCALCFGLKQYERNARVEALARQAELRALRNQLTPHFLCNTLNGISTLVGEGQVQQARRMIARLGDFLRSTLDGSGALEVSLAQEISYLEQYLAIEQTRLGERLGAQIEVTPEVLDAAVPNLLLQPLVENAVQHGVVPFPAGGDVSIRAVRSEGRLCLTVRNRCRSAAFTTEEIPSSLSSHPPGLGLRNTAERLEVAYGVHASMSCRQDDAHSWTTTIELPFHLLSDTPEDPLA